MSATTPQAQREGLTDRDDLHYAGLCFCCKQPVVATCDFVLSDGRICKHRLCTAHAKSVGDGKHQCSEHQLQEGD